MALNFVRMIEKFGEKLKLSEQLVNTLKMDQSLSLAALKFFCLSEKSKSQSQLEKIIPCFEARLARRARLDQFLLEVKND